jgi:hypothetical protein
MAVPNKVYSRNYMLFFFRLAIDFESCVPHIVGEHQERTVAKKPYKYSPKEIESIRVRLDALGIPHGRLARELKRSPGAISHAFRGERMTLLARIDKWLKRYLKTTGTSERGHSREHWQGPQERRAV